MTGTGKLNAEQFALAMYFIALKFKGVDPPQALTTEMIPPSMRAKPGVDGTLVRNCDLSLTYKMFREASCVKKP